MEQTSKLKEMQTKVERIVKFNSTKYLYAGGAVLDAYYGTSFANDVDVFVPYHPDLDTGIELLDQTKYTMSNLSETEYNFDMLYKVINVYCVETYQHVVDIVFIRVPSPNISMEKFHHILVDQFDVKICSLAWDGNNLYYPPLELADLNLKTSKVKIQMCKIPSPIDDARHVVYVHNHRLVKEIKRFNKYQERGFKLTGYACYW